MFQLVTPGDLGDAAPLDLFLCEGPCAIGLLCASGPRDICGRIAAGSVRSILLLSDPIGRPGDSACIPAVYDPSAGEAGLGRTEARIADLLAACRGTLEADGRVAVTVGNRLRAKLRNAGTCPQPSLRRLIALLRQAGYADIEVYALSPSPARPREFRPVAQTARGLLSPLVALHATLFAPGFLVTAGASLSARPTRLAAMVAALPHPAPEKARANRDIGHVVASPKGKSIAFAEVDGMPVVIRVPHTAAAAAVEARAHAVLVELTGNHEVAGRVPQPLLAATAGGVAFFAERRLPGSLLAGILRPAQRPAWVREVDSFLRALNPGLPATPARPLAGAWAVNIVQPMLDRLLSCVSDARLRERAQPLLEDALRGAACRPGLMHGDFSTRNILVRVGRITGVIDWEDALHDALPVLDAFNYLDSAHRLCHRGLTLADTIPLLANGTWPVAAEAEFLREFFRYCGVDFRFRRGFALLYWLYHVGPQLALADASAAVRIEDVLKNLVP